jgi:integrase/recombinase XerC
MPALPEPAPATVTLSADLSTDNATGAANPEHVHNPADRNDARSFEPCLRDFLAVLAEDHVSARPARLYVGHLARFAAWLRERYRASVLEATSHDLREYREQLAARQRPVSVNGALAALRRFYRWAAAAGRVRTDPTAKVKLLPAQPLAPKGFSRVERQRLRREAERTGPMADAIVTTLLNTGLRVDELVRLTWEDVTVQERAGSARVRGKGQKVRVVPLNAAVRQALAGVQPLAPAHAAGPIFRGKRGPYTDRGVRWLLATLGRRADVQRVHPHRFRHDTARRLVGAVDLPTVAALLGHSRLDTVRIYSQPDQAALERAAALLETR